jgi:hypothetical protein
VKRRLLNFAAWLSLLLGISILTIGIISYWRWFTLDYTPNAAALRDGYISLQFSSIPHDAEARHDTFKTIVARWNLTG